MLGSQIFDYWFDSSRFVVVRLPHDSRTLSQVNFANLEVRSTTPMEISSTRRRKLHMSKPARRPFLYGHRRFLLYSKNDVIFE